MGVTLSLADLRRQARDRPTRLAVYPDDAVRPRTRGDCKDNQDARPCPWVSCRYHLYLDVDELTGAIKFNFPTLEPWELDDTCALDIADQAGATLEDIAAAINVTRERVRQLETRAIGEARASAQAFELAERKAG